MKRVSQSAESSSGRGEASKCDSRPKKRLFSLLHINYEFTERKSLGIFVLSTSAAPPSRRQWGFFCVCLSVG